MKAKKLPFRESVSIIVFVLIVCISLLLAFPVFASISKKLSTSVSRLFSSVQEKTGISVTYRSLSPAVFSGIRVNDITLYDSFEGESVLKIKRVSLRYNFSRILKRDFTHLFTGLTIDGIVLDLDRDGNLELIKKMQSISEQNKALSEESASQNSLEDKAGQQKDRGAAEKNSLKKQENDLKEKILNFFEIENLFDVLIKNIHVRYSVASDTADAFFKRITLNIQEKQRSISVKTGGSLLYYKGESGKSLSCSFNADGNLVEKLDGSLVNFQISDFTDGNFNFKRLNLLFSYENDKISLITVKNSYPFVLSGNYDFSNEVADISFKASSLTAGTLLSFKKESPVLRFLDNIIVSTELGLSYSVKNKALLYGASGSMHVKKEIFEGGEDLVFSLDGNEKKIQVSELALTGEKLNADFSGTFDFENFGLSGMLNLYNYTLNNGGNISTEVFFEQGNNSLSSARGKKSRGFMAFAPQLMFDSKSYTALELNVSPEEDSVDFTFELSDYSHADYEKPGLIQVSGSYLNLSKYLQINVSAQDMFLDSVADSALFFTPKKEMDIDFLSPFMFNADLYIASDMKTISYNLPYLLVADTKKDNLFLYASVDGNDTSLSVSKIDLIYGGNLSSLSARLDFSPDHKEAFFSLDANHQSIPYHLAGTVMEKSVSLSGDWGLSFNINNSHSDRFDGAFTMGSFPVKISDSIFTFSLDSAFSYSKRDGFLLNIAKFETEDAGSRFNFHPHLFFSGSVSKYGAFLQNITYSDKFSALGGDLNLIWNINDSIFSSAALDFNLKNQLSSESLKLTAELSNLSGQLVNGKNFKDSLYLNSQLVLTNLALSRFLTEISDNNLFTGTFIASGTLDNPYIAAKVDSVKLMAAGQLLSVSGSGYVEEKELTLENINVAYSGFDLSGIKAKFDLEKFTGDANASFDAVMGDKNLHVPISLTMTDSRIPAGSLFPEDFTINLSLEGISGSLLEKPLPLSMTMIYSKGAAAIYSSELFAFSGYISENGEMDFSVPQDRALSFNIKGNAYSDNLDVKIQNINADLSRLLSYFNLGDFAVNRASLKGNLNIGGIKSDPDFEGSMLLSGVEWEMSSLVPYRLTAGRIPITFEHNHIQIPEFKGLIKRSNAFFASADVYFDRWNFDRLDATLRTPKDAFIPLSVNVPQAQLKGDLSSSVQISFQDNIVDLQGYLNFKNTNAKVTSRDLFSVQAFGSKQAAPKKEMYVHTDLDIFFGQHVNFTFDPVLRAVFVPETKFNLKCDTEDNSFNLDGDILLKSGDIAYLSRNFYLKNGILRFNKNETSFNPYITVTAETRERDSDGNDVRIILSVLNQELLNFEPQFSSIPVKSENEIRTMLGQIAIGDSENVSSLLLATGDYAIQSTIGRSLENTLREYLNFDIFSVRTKVLQNALKQNFSTGSDENKRAIGNYLDNSTVYIGKYFGSSLYADALMHLSYGEGIEGKFEGMSNGLEFQPEIGFEMDISQMFAPVWNIFLPKIGLNPSMAVANIRWSMDFNYQPATAVPLDFNNAITLSWKLSF